MGNARWTAVATSIVSVCFLLAVPARAQDEHPSVRAARIDASEAPVIDGNLSDPAWAKAAIITKLAQRKPNPGAPPTQRTVVRIMFDRNNLYFGVYCYDTEPDKIVEQSMARDGPIQTGDKIAIFLDPGLTRRDAYYFQVGVSGERDDSLILNNSDELENWNPIWSAKARRVADGWVAEIAIPFQSLSYDANNPDWGFEFVRNVRRANENIQWSSHDAAAPYTDVSREGTLTGITNVTQGLGLDIQVYGVGHVVRDWQIPNSTTALSFTAGGNAFYRITPSFTGTLTFNPDFSDAPLDPRQVNTTRFSLFTPETREFFLQDAAAFEFGGEGFTYGNDRTINNGRPFFSRNIGLVNGQQVGIVGGGKLSGTFAGFGVGALSVVTADNPVPSQMLSVVRITHPVLGESRLGMVFTHGDPTGATENNVGGADFQYRDSNWLGDQILESDFFYERSFSNLRGDDNAFGVVVDAPNEPWGWHASFKQVGKNFDPALGFINRLGIRRYDGSLTRVTRFPAGFLEDYEVQASGSFFTDLNGRTQTRQGSLLASALTRTDDTYQVSVEDDLENVRAPFGVGGVTVAPGHYHWTNAHVQFKSSQGRAYGLNANITCCSYYGGDMVDANVTVDFRPNRFFQLSTQWEGTFLDLPGGAVDIHVLSVDGSVNFTPDMDLALQAQYDNISKQFGFLARYRWEYAAGDELFVAFGQAAGLVNNQVQAERSLFSVRLQRTFRF